MSIVKVNARSLSKQRQLTFRQAKKYRKLPMVIRRKFAVGTDNSYKTEILNLRIIPVKNSPRSDAPITVARG